MPDALLEPWRPALGSAQPVEAERIADTQVLADTADRITAARVARVVGREMKTMSLLGKMAHLTESAQDFHKETEAVLDGIAEKIAVGKAKRDEAARKHHAYYDTIIAGVDESTKVIDRLSNGPLHGDGEG